MKPGDLVRLCERGGSVLQTVGSVNKNSAGFAVPAGSIALVLKIEMNTNQDDPDTCSVHILVDGKQGWIYPEDGEVINEAR